MAEQKKGFAGYGYVNPQGDRVTALRDMIDGGGKGQSGDTFEGGGILSLIANMVATPYGSQRERSFGLIPGERSPQAPAQSVRPMQRPAAADVTAAEDLLMGMPVTPLSPGVAAGGPMSPGGGFSPEGANATLNPGLATGDPRQLISDPRIPDIVKEEILRRIMGPQTSGMA